MSKVYYFEGNYKYQLAKDYELQTSIIPPVHVHHDYFMLDKTGYLVIRKGYAWDGASGPTIDTSDSIRGSLVHDVLYQMIGHKLLPLEYRDAADYLFYDLLQEDGMASFRAWAWFRAVRTFGLRPAINDEKPMRCAPRISEPRIYNPSNSFGRA